MELSTFGAEHFMIASLGVLLCPEFGMFHFNIIYIDPN
jgi:hypothetical protein